LLFRSFFNILIFIIISLIQPTKFIEQDFKNRLYIVFFLNIYFKQFVK
jgi:hypothetical protein